MSRYIISEARFSSTKRATNSIPELVPGGHCGDDIRRIVPFHVQINALRRAGILVPAVRLVVQWNTLVVRPAYHAEVKLGLHNPIDMIFHMQPWMILAVLPFTIGFEGIACAG